MHVKQTDRLPRRDVEDVGTFSDLPVTSEHVLLPSYPTLFVLEPLRHQPSSFDFDQSSFLTHSLNPRLRHFIERDTGTTQPVKTESDFRIIFSVKQIQLSRNILTFQNVKIYISLIKHLLFF